MFIKAADNTSWMWFLLPRFTVKVKPTVTSHYTVQHCLIELQIANLCSSQIKNKKGKKTWAPVAAHTCDKLHCFTNVQLMKRWHLVKLWKVCGVSMQCTFTSFWQLRKISHSVTLPLIYFGKFCKFYLQEIALTILSLFFLFSVIAAKIHLLQVFASLLTDKSPTTLWHHTTSAMLMMTGNLDTVLTPLPHPLHKPNLE